MRLASRASGKSERPERPKGKATETETRPESLGKFPKFHHAESLFQSLNELVHISLCLFSYTLFHWSIKMALSCRWSKNYYSYFMTKDMGIQHYKLLAQGPTESKIWSWF